MKKLLYVLLTGLMIVALSPRCVAQAPLDQQAWIPEIEVYKTVINGGIPQAFRFISVDATSTWTIGGAFDTALRYNNRGTQVIQKLAGIKNMLRKMPDGTLTNPGFVYIDQSSHVASYGNLYGSEYVSPHNLTYQFIRKLNVSTGVFEAVPGMVLDGYAGKMFEWGNNNILLVGTDAGTFRFINGLEYRLMALWNPQTNAIQRISSSMGDGMPGYSDGMMVNDTFYVGMNFPNEFRLWGIKKGALTWIENIVTGLPCHQVLKIYVENGATYAFIGTYALKYELWKHKNGTWQKLFDCTPIDYINNNNSPIKGFTVRNGIVYFAGQFTQVNGQPMNGLAAYDENTGAITKLGISPPLGSNYNSYQCEGMYWINNILYMPMYGGIKQMIGTQVIFSLRDTIAPIPSITGPSGIQDLAFTVTGTAAPNMSVKLYQIGSPTPSVLSSNATGDWNVPFSNMPPGTYQFYATSVNSSGWESPPSATKTVVVNVATAISAPVFGPDASFAFPNPATSKVTIKNARQLLAVYAIDGKNCKEKVTWQRSGENITLFVSELPQGMYLIECVNHKKKNILVRITKI
jgi:hypothetical protein